MFELSDQFINDGLVTLGVIFGLYIVRFLVLRVLHAKMQDTVGYYKLKRFVVYSTFVIGVLILIPIWFNNKVNMGTYLGLTSAGLAVALKDLVINIAAWFFIMLKRPFRVGDRIEIDGVHGDIIDQRLFQFSLMEIGNWVSHDQSTGRIVHVPNSHVFTRHLANYTTGFKYIWHEINVLLTFESDWRHAKEELLTIAHKHSLHLTSDVEARIRQASKKYMIYYKYLTPIVYTDVKESGVQLTLRYLCEPQKRRQTNDAVWEDILTYIEGHDEVTLAYPTLRVTH